MADSDRLIKKQMKRVNVKNNSCLDVKIVPRNEAENGFMLV